MQTIIRPLAGAQPNWDALEKVFCYIQTDVFERYQKLNKIIAVNEKSGWCTLTEDEANEYEETQKNLAKKDAIEKILINLFAVNLGIDIPNNIEDITQYCFEDVCDTADPIQWHDGDVRIALRRWIEKQP